MKGTKKKYTKKIEKTDYWNSPNKARLTKGLKGHNQKAYYHYRKHRKTKHEIGENRTLYANTVGSIFKAISELMCEYEGGVFLKDYGLFTGMVIPWENKGINIRNSKDMYFHTDGYNYCLQFFPEVTRNSCLAGMQMDRTFEQKLSTKFSKALFDGFRPKLYYTNLKSLNGNKPRKK